MNWARKAIKKEVTDKIRSTLVFQSNFTYPMEYDKMAPAREIRRIFKI